MAEPSAASSSPTAGPPTLGPPFVAVVLKGYPRLSETFIAQEILGLQRLGLPLRLISLRHPTDKTTHPIHAEITAPVSYLPEYLYHEPLRVLRGWWKARRLPGYGRALRQWLADWRRDPTSNRGRRWGQALVLAAELPDDVGRLYFHFLHTPGSVARYAALMRGLPLCGSAHAKDIWTIPTWEKAEKLADVDWLSTCTAVNRDHLAALAPDPGRVHLVYHGLDLTRFPDGLGAGAGIGGECGAESDTRAPAPDGRDPARPVTLISVGRAVEKKGYPVLLEALAALPADCHWRLVHIGGGKDSAALKTLTGRLGLTDRIDWRGAQPQAAVLEALRAADLFVLASRITADGDRDGLPNVLMEAQSQRLACVSTAVSAIPELIEDGVNGVLVPPDDPQALSAALARVIGDPALRARLADAGAAKIRSDFSHDACLGHLAPLFGLDMPAPGASPVPSGGAGA